MTTKLGDLLRSARTGKGWTLREVEEKTGVHNAHLTQIETGKITRPAPPILMELARVFELEFTELMELAGHLERRPPANRGVLLSAAFSTISELTEEEQADVLRYMENKLRERRER